MGADLRVKACGTCKVERPLGEFAFSKNGSQGRHAYCRACDSKRRVKWATDNAERISKTVRLRKYGTTGESEFAAQGGNCAICAKPLEALFAKGAVVDHCHVSGIARGVLCHHCNLLLGLAKDDTSVLRAAVAYLESRGVFE